MITQRLMFTLGTVRHSLRKVWPRFTLMHRSPLSRVLTTPL